MALNHLFVNSDEESLFRTDLYGPLRNDPSNTVPGLPDYPASSLFPLAGQAEISGAIMIKGVVCDPDPSLISDRNLSMMSRHLDIEFQDLMQDPDEEDYKYARPGTSGTCVGPKTLYQVKALKSMSSLPFRVSEGSGHANGHGAGDGLRKLHQGLGVLMAADAGRRFVDVCGMFLRTSSAADCKALHQEGLGSFTSIPGWFFLDPKNVKRIQKSALRMSSMHMGDMCTCESHRLGFGICEHLREMIDDNALVYFGDVCYYCPDLDDLLLFVEDYQKTCDYFNDRNLFSSTYSKPFIGTDNEFHVNSEDRASVRTVVESIPKDFFEMANTKPEEIPTWMPLLAGEPRIRAKIIANLRGSSFGGLPTKGDAEPVIRFLERYDNVFWWLDLINHMKRTSCQILSSEHNVVLDRIDLDVPVLIRDEEALVTISPDASARENRLDFKYYPHSPEGDGYSHRLYANGQGALSDYFASYPESTSIMNSIKFGELIDAMTIDTTQKVRAGARYTHRYSLFQYHLGPVEKVRRRVPDFTYELDGGSRVALSDPGITDKVATLLSAGSEEDSWTRAANRRLREEDPTAKKRWKCLEKDKTSILVDDVEKTGILYAKRFNCGNRVRFWEDHSRGVKFNYDAYVTCRSTPKTSFSAFTWRSLCRKILTGRETAAEAEAKHWAILAAMLTHKAEQAEFEELFPVSQQ